MQYRIDRGCFSNTNSTIKCKYKSRATQYFEKGLPAKIQSYSCCRLSANISVTRTLILKHLPLASMPYSCHCVTDFYFNDIENKFTSHFTMALIQQYNIQMDLQISLPTLHFLDKQNNNNNSTAWLKTHTTYVVHVHHDCKLKPMSWLILSIIQIIIIQYIGDTQPALKYNLGLDSLLVNL